MLTSLKKNFLYRSFTTFLWLLVLVGLPLTSFPIFNRLTGALVAPFSAIPMALLLVIWLIPFLLEQRKLPVEIVPFLYFILITLIVSALGFFLPGYYERGRDFFDQTVRAFITVGIGLGFYLIFAAFPKNDEIIQKTFVIIYIVGVILIGWTLFEVKILRTYSLVQGLPDWVVSFRSALAVQSPNIIFTNRVTGFSYEPSWHVRQFNLILFPIWLSAIFQRESIFKYKLWIFQIEDFLMAAGLMAFGYSSPRIGLLAFLASVGFLGFLLWRYLHQRLIAWYLKQRRQPPRTTIWLKVFLAALMVAVTVVFTASALTSYITMASGWDNRYALLLRESTLESIDIFPLTETRLIYSARNLAFFERMIFWVGGWNIFNDFPFGVGLGNAGFYFMDRMHGAALESVELRNLVYRANYLSNTKSLWIRLLSETGFIGFSVFLTWVYLLWRSTGLTRKSDSKILRIVGLAGQLFLLAFLIEGFSMDSFAMPDQWFMIGLISAGGFLARHEISAKAKLQTLVPTQVS